MIDRVWNIRYLRPEEGKRDRWSMGVGIYRKDQRSDGLLIWKLDSAPSELEYPNGATPEETNARIAQAEAEGAKLGFPRDYNARHGGLAVEWADLVEPAVEATWRLEGVNLWLLWKWATKAKKRCKVVLGRAPKGGHYSIATMVKKIGCVTPKQLTDLVLRLQLQRVEVDKLPKERTE